MRNRKNIAFGTAILVLALAFGVGANQWLEPGSSWAADALQQTFINEEAAATVAEIAPTQEVLADLYDQVAPSVVNIQVTAVREGMQQQLPLPFGPEGDQPVQGQGSGWIYDDEGHIVTNNHVVEGATEMTVYFSNGMWADAELVATDPSADLAVIKVTPPEGVEWTPLSLAEANSLRVGFSVVAVGSPFGLQETMTAGVVSAIGRSVPTGTGLETGSTYSLPDVIQTDTAINPGNSGGPLLNVAGQVVGVNFAINSLSGSNSGVGFAIPVSVVEKIIPALINDGSFEYSFLGVSGATVNAQVAEQNDIEENTLGVYVAEAVSGGPAAEGGVEAGDVIVGINDVTISHFEELISYLFNFTVPGDTVTLHLMRDGEAMDVEVTVTARPSQEAPQDQARAPRMEVTISEAIRTATAAVQEAGLMEEAGSASAQASELNGQPVWVVTLSGENQTAVVTVDGITGEVLELNVN